MPDAESPVPYLRHLAAAAPEALDISPGVLTDDAAGVDARTITTLELHVTATTATEDDDVALLASLHPETGPTGAVYFCVDDEIVASCDAIDGHARVMLAFDEGEHALTAHYVGDARHHAAESPVVAIRVSRSV